MSAVWLRLRAEGRGRWRAWLGVALLAGVFGGAVLAAAAGAARTGSVVDRYLRKLPPQDVFFAPAFVAFSSDDPEAFVEALRFEEIAKLGSVKEAVRGIILPHSLADDEEGLEILASEDPRLGRELFPVKLLEGRAPDPRRPNEATVNAKASENYGLHAGDTYTIKFLKEWPDFMGSEEEPQPGPTVTFNIVGVTAHIGDVAEIAGNSIALTPAFLATYGDQISGTELMMLQLREGARSYAQFDREIQGLSGGQTVLYIQSGDWDEARRSFNLQAVALWILAGILALVTVLVVGQTVARQTFLDSSDHSVLRALGTARGSLVALGIMRAAIIGLVGAAVAIVVAAAASPLTPFGNARMVDPDAGFSVPFVPMLLGFVGVFVGVVALSLFPAWRAARVAAAGLGPSEQRATDRPSAVAEAISRAARGPAAGVGVRMALEAGRGRTAVPVRTTVTATVIGVVALVAALVVGASLDRLTNTPRLYGWDWDVIVTNESEGDSDIGAVLQGFADPEQRSALTGIPGVADASFGPLGGIIVVDRVTTDPYGLSLGARVHPPILEGRAPRSPNEIAVARKTLRATGKKIGDVVKIGFPGTEERERFRIVGITVLPIVESDTAALGDGVWVPLEGVAPLFGGVVPMDGALVRFEPTADKEAIIKEIRSRFGPGAVDIAKEPVTVLDFGRVANMPYLLAGVVAFLAAGTLTHGLVTAVRRRRRDLAVLKTLGLDRGQVRRAVAWQASTTSIITLVIGVPLGVILGRLVWMVFANQLGFVPAPVVDLAMIMLIVPAALFTANLIAALPGRSAARTRPALVLRTE